MGSIFHTLLFQPLLNTLIFLYQVLFQNFGLAIIALTLLIRFALIPLTLPALKASQKIRELQPELEKLKKKYKKNKQALAQAQLKLYQKHGASPAAGCLPQIIQIIVLIALFQAFNHIIRPENNTIAKINEILYPFLRLPADTSFNTRFLYLDLTKPDIIHLPLKFGNFSLPGVPGFFLIISALAQFLSSLMMLPQTQAAQVKAKETPQKEDDIATSMQSQMIYLFPLMTILIGFSFPSGLVLYWATFSLTTMIQHFFVFGPGGLTPYLQKLRLTKT
jgi:YidC/Oxa1 family membrane protein insertase